jgi:DNA uptake protein ComE-like DNA-binding protein
VIWTQRQRDGLALLGLLVAAILGWRLVQRPAEAPHTRSQPGARAGELPRGLDPNTADVAAWASVPGVGEALAGRIVAFRQQRQQERPGMVVFCTPEDLESVPGIGPALAESMAAHLDFPAMVSDQEVP